MKDGSEEKMMPLFWLHQLHAPSLVSIGQNKLKQVKLTNKKNKINRHDPSIVVHIYFKFHEILPASE